MRKNALGVNLSVSILREGKRYIAYSPALDLSTAGKTYIQAKKRFGEAVNIFFEETLKRGTLGEALRELGWVKNHSQWQPPVLVGQEIETFKLPAFA